MGSGGATSAGHGKHETAGGAQRHNKVCRGWEAEEDAVGFSKLGHSIVRAEGSHPVVFCSKCGAFRNRRARKLKAHCVKLTVGGAQALKRLQAGRSPLQSRGFGGVLMQQGRATVIAKFEAREKKLCNSVYQGTVWGPPLWNTYSADSSIPIDGACFCGTKFTDDL